MGADSRGSAKADRGGGDGHVAAVHGLRRSLRPSSRHRSRQVSLRQGAEESRRRRAQEGAQEPQDGEQRRERLEQDEVSLAEESEELERCPARAVRDDEDRRVAGRPRMVDRAGV